MPPLDKKCRKVIKQENCENIVKIPKNAGDKKFGTTILTTKNGQQIFGQKIGQNFIIHKNQIILDKKFSVVTTRGAVTNTEPVQTGTTLVQTTTDGNIKQEPQDNSNR